MKTAILALSLLFSISMARAESVPLEKLKPVLHEVELREKVLLYFWASWCPDCREKLNGPLGQLAAEYPNVSFVTVNADRDEAKGKAYAVDNKIPLAVFRDEEKALAKSLKLFAVPAWALVKKKDGKWELIKSATGADLEAIRMALKQEQK